MGSAQGLLVVSTGCPWIQTWEDGSIPVWSGEVYPQLLPFPFLNKGLTLYPIFQDFNFLIPSTSEIFQITAWGFTCLSLLFPVLLGHCSLTLGGLSISPHLGLDFLLSC